MTSFLKAPTLLRQGFLLALLLCALPLCIVSADGKVSVKFLNALKDDNVPITIFWRGPSGEEKPATHLIHKGSSQVVETFEGHVFVAYDQSMGFFKEFRIPEAKGVGEIEIPVYNLVKKVSVARFVNNLASEEPIEIYWINGATGEEKKVSAKIGVGEWDDVETHRRHKFVARSLQGKLLREFEVEAVPGVREQFTVGDNAKATFYNAMKKPMRLFWKNVGTGEETAASEPIAPGASHPVFSHPGHKFVVYDDKMRRSKEYTVNAKYGEHQQFHVEL